MSAVGDEPIAIDDRTSEVGDRPWFVYLLPLQDCSAFKVGFSCHPLQRMYSFSSRYFERFDLSQSVLLQLDECAHARAAEADMKHALTNVRVDAPEWIPIEAGGQTEWFSAVHFGQAHDRLNSMRDVHSSSHWFFASDFIRSELTNVVAPFESWACHCAQRICDDYESVCLGYEPTVSARSLRDWVDAFRFFEVPIFKDDAAMLEFVQGALRLR